MKKTSLVPDALSCFFFHHSVKNEMTQDWVAFSILKGAIFTQIGVDLPHVKNVSIVSDNVSCYQCYMLAIVLPLSLLQIICSFWNICILMQQMANQ